MRDELRGRAAGSGPNARGGRRGSPPRRPPRWPSTGPRTRRPRSTNSVGATSASTIVAVPSTAPGDVERSRGAGRPRRPRRCRHRTPTIASTAIGTFTSSRTCQGATASTKPPTVGPIASPTRPTVEMSVVARTRRPSSSNSRKASAIEPGVVIAAATPIAARTAMSCSAVVTNAVARLATPSSDQPDEHDPTSAEPVGERAERQHQPAEHDRVGAGHPLQRGGRRVQLAPDRRQRDVQDRVVQHLEEEHGGQPRQGHPGLPQR